MILTVKVIVARADLRFSRRSRGCTPPPGILKTRLSNMHFFLTPLSNNLQQEKWPKAYKLTHIHPAIVGPRWFRPIPSYA